MQGTIIYYEIDNVYLFDATHLASQMIFDQIKWHLVVQGLNGICVYAQHWATHHSSL